MILLSVAAYAGCESTLPEVRDDQSVVWISPLNKRVGVNTPLRVIPMSALQKAASDGMTVGRLLQLLGEQKQALAPRKEWKVTVFQASSGALCRPIGDLPATDFVGGLPVCPSNWSGPRRKVQCGRTVDRQTNEAGLEVFVARWRDLAPQGFCVMPADRFVSELAR